MTGTELAGDNGSLNVAIIGHEGHGKTTLATALVGYSGLRGFSGYRFIELFDQEHKPVDIGDMTVAKQATSEDHYSHTSGYSEETSGFIRLMGQVDGAILVIAANEGVMPQTKEHVRLAREVNLRGLVVFMNKMDIVDNELGILDIVEMDIRDLLNEYEFPGDEIPIIRGSALKAVEGPDDPENEVYKPLQELVNAMAVRFAGKRNGG